MNNKEANLTSDAYHFTLNYPETYKSNETKIVKFERDYNRFLEYRFIGLFPLSLNSVKVSYQGSQLLKATATFSYDRYVCGESSSLARSLGKLFNNRDNVGSRFPGDPNNVYQANQQLHQVMGTTPLLNSNLASLNRTIQNSFTQTFNTDAAGLFIGESRR